MRRNMIPLHYSRQEIETFRDKIGVGNAPMILFIGRLTWVKGVDNLVRAMPAIIREIPDAKLVILGLGEMTGCLSISCITSTLKRT